MGPTSSRLEFGNPLPPLLPPLLRPPCCLLLGPSFRLLGVKSVLDPSALGPGPNRPLDLNDLGGWYEHDLVRRNAGVSPGRHRAQVIGQAVLVLERDPPCLVKV